MICNNLEPQVHRMEQQINTLGPRKLAKIQALVDGAQAKLDAMTQEQENTVSHPSAAVQGRDPQQPGCEVCVREWCTSRLVLFEG